MTSTGLNNPPAGICRALFCAAVLMTTIPAHSQSLPPATLVPVTQNRDHELYDWMERHNAILERHRNASPDILVIGDSIMHYWGGDPGAPLAWGAPSWEACFEGYRTSNLGCGWDRVENVLWRITNGELDGTHPRLIILKIGTNNIGISTEDEIVDGIRNLCREICDRLPDAPILLMGILPRRDGPESDRTVQAVNRRLQHFSAGHCRIIFRDAGPVLRGPDGVPEASYYRDPVHLNSQGYERLGAFIHESMRDIL